MDTKSSPQSVLQKRKKKAPSSTTDERKLRCVALSSFVFPSKMYRLPNDVFIPDDLTSAVDDEFYGLNSLTYYKKISHFEADRKAGIFKLFLNPVDETTQQFPAQYVIDRFKGFSDERYHKIAEVVEKFTKRCTEQAGNSPNHESEDEKGVKKSNRTVQTSPFATKPIVLEANLEDYMPKKTPAVLMINQLTNGGSDAHIRIVAFNYALLDLLEFTMDEMTYYQIKAKGILPVFTKERQFEDYIATLEVWANRTTGSEHVLPYETQIEAKRGKRKNVAMTTKVLAWPKQGEIACLTLFEPKP